MRKTLRIFLILVLLSIYLTVTGQTTTSSGPGFTVGVGFAVDVVTVMFGIGYMVHSGTTFPVLLYSTGHWLQNLQGYGLFSIGGGIGFGGFDFLGGAGFMTLGCDFYYFGNTSSVGAHLGFIFSPRTPFGLYFVSQIGAILGGGFIPFIPTLKIQLGATLVF
ncbi:hypothetical protein [Fervidobacterium thailandense]|uniref:Uncharacterized protein n=1 Tax=Fervidobacterium thailandense TaxID=1008305 RepID=A0A1E3G3B0_9BACT|nr:hypothetical protein [Fervidobacterium thailandense]ODN30751.1 hypothetical protein A4H02_04280 [Fervidobacterium thailandense]